MPKRVGTHIEVKSYSRHNTWFVPRRGFAATDYAAGWRNTATCPQFDSGAEGLPYGVLPTVTTFTIGDRTFSMPTPVVDVVSGRWLDGDFYATTGTGWEALQRADGVYWMHLRNQTPQAAQVASLWAYPPDPIICIGLWRGEYNSSWTPAGLAPLTAIGWGGEDGTASQFRLVLPYGGQGATVETWNPFADQWETLRCRGGGALTAGNGTANGEWWTFWIAHWYGKLYISSDGFQQNVAEYDIPEEFRDAAGRVKYPYYGNTCLSGPVKVYHSAGECGVSIHPIWMPNGTAGQTVSLTSTPREVGYIIDDNPNSPVIEFWHAPVYDDPAPDGTRTVLREVNASSATVTTSATSYTWTVSWNPIAWNTTVGGSTVSTYVGPTLQAVQVRQNPHISGTGSAYTSALLPVAELELEYPGAGRPTTGRIQAWNVGSALGSAVQDYRRVSITAGPKLDNGSHAASLVFSGYMITPGRDAAVREADKAGPFLFDDLVRLRDGKAGADEPDLSPLTGNDCLRWAFMRGGLPSSVISGPSTATTLFDNADTDYNPESKAWVPQFGRAYEQLAAEALKADGDSTYYSVPQAAGTWIKVVRTNGPFAGTSTDYEIKENSAKGSSINHLFSIRLDRRGHDSDEYANLVYLLGQDTDGKPLAGWALDPTPYNPGSEAYTGGWDHTYAERDDTLQSDTAVLDRALDLQTEKGTIAEYVEVTTDMLPSLRYGHVVAFSGPATGRLQTVGARGRKYRVEAFKHRMAVGQLPQTTITARYIGDV